ncbi:MAG: hypothetical protein WDK96_01880 [Candidatus Paceibacterota bacterium]|jgi:hypothetical protein
MAKIEVKGNFDLPNLINYPAFREHGAYIHAFKLWYNITQEYDEELLKLNRTATLLELCSKNGNDLIKTIQEVCEHDPELRNRIAQIGDIEHGKFFNGIKIGDTLVDYTICKKCGFEHHFKRFPWVNCQHCGCKQMNHIHTDPYPDEVMTDKFEIQIYECKECHKRIEAEFLKGKVMSV